MSPSFTPSLELGIMSLGRVRPIMKWINCELQSLAAKSKTGDLRSDGATRVDLLRSEKELLP